MDGGKQPSRKDTAFMQAYERVHKRHDADPKRFGRQRLNLAESDVEALLCASESS